MKYSGVITSNPHIPATQNTTFANRISPPLYSFTPFKLVILRDALFACPPKAGVPKDLNRCVLP
jgi:hypothetical protein